MGFAQSEHTFVSQEFQSKCREREARTTHPMDGKPQRVYSPRIPPSSCRGGYVHRRRKCPNEGIEGTGNGPRSDARDCCYRTRSGPAEDPTKPKSPSSPLLSRGASKPAVSPPPECKQCAFSRTIVRALQHFPAYDIRHGFVAACAIWQVFCHTVSINLLGDWP